MENKLPDGIKRAYAERQDLLVIALTGRTGSGCSTAAGILSKDISDITIAPPRSGTSRTPEAEKRKTEIIKTFAEKNWVPFIRVSASCVIFTFLVTDTGWNEIEIIVNEAKIRDASLQKLKKIIEELKSDPMIEDFKDLVHARKEDYNAESAINIYLQQITTASEEAKKILGSEYAKLFQVFGNNIRLSGNPTDNSVFPEKIFSLVERITLIINAIGKHKENDARVTIDAIRNPLELVYLRDRFPQLFTVAITCDENDRRARLSALGLNGRQIDKIDGQEYPKTRKSLDSYESFVSQNLQDCIQKSDIFINNSGGDSRAMEKKALLGTQLVKYVSLALRPGLVTPTRDERCMQLAFVAKLNSGCISRQVGAAVADDLYSVKAIGWNDVPSGQIPCLLRDAEDLISMNDADAFSEYEKNDPEFASKIRENTMGREGLRTQEGLRCPFCFKQLYNEIQQQKNQVHTRSLHAEENAFLQLAKSASTGINNGVLFTTASPCELCSKKAFQLGIREIIYVDPYPGISTSHILASGDRTKRPKLILFCGAVGHAYHRLYEPIMNIKDEIQARLNLRQPKLL